MLSVHFRRIALAQGLLATTAEKSPPAEAARASTAPNRAHEHQAHERTRADTSPLPRPESRKTS